MAIRLPEELVVAEQEKTRWAEKCNAAMLREMDCRDELRACDRRMQDITDVLERRRFRHHIAIENGYFDLALMWRQLIKEAEEMLEFEREQYSVVDEMRVNAHGAARLAASEIDEWHSAELLIKSRIKDGWAIEAHAQGAAYG